MIVMEYFNMYIYSPYIYVKPDKNSLPLKFLRSSLLQPISEDV